MGALYNNVPVGRESAYRKAKGAPDLNNESKMHKHFHRVYNNLKILNYLTLVNIYGIFISEKISEFYFRTTSLRIIEIRNSDCRCQALSININTQ